MVLVTVKVLILQTALCLPAYKLEEVCAFPSSPSSSPGPWAPLIMGNDGAFYGTTYAGGSNGYGSVFRVTTNKVLTTLVSFANTNGAYPRSALLLGRDGAFYGTTSFGGSHNGGTAFRLASNGELATLVHFDGTNGYGPAEDLVLGNDGALYGTTASDSFGGFGTVFRLATNGTLTTLAFFDGTNGYYPRSSLLLASDGAFYGTTFYAAPVPPTLFGYGNVFRLSAGGVLTSLATFAYTNGANPTGKLIQGADGALYGTTRGGFFGKVFRATTNGLLDAFVSFDPFADPPQGGKPWSGLMLGSDGAYYGTGSSGGTYNYGTVFRITTNGVLTTFASFNNTNGAGPFATLVQAKDGAAACCQLTARVTPGT